MLQILAIAAGAAVLGVLGVAARKPGTFRVQRSTLIHAPPEAILPHIANLRAWAGWSPYEKLDPQMKKTFSGPGTGPGSTCAWEGNSKAGAGRMEIRESSPTRVSVQLDFTRPFEAHNIATFTLQPRGDRTEVTWAMDGPQPFMQKVMCVFINMDRLVGKDFEAGLASLKTLVEGQPSPAPAQS